jgi:hypothetical protein
MKTNRRVLHHRQIPLRPCADNRCPVTAEGRLIAVVFMLAGIGVIGGFTSTIASVFMTPDEEDEFGAIHVRLDRLEAKLDR